MAKRARPIAVVTALCLLAAFVLPAVPQPTGYHDFADHRAWFGVANFLDVASNVGFLLVALLGFGAVFAAPAAFAERRERVPYLVFFTGMLLTAIGSAYYHLAPDNERLFWDRLPMTIAFMSLLAAQVADRLSVRAGLLLLVPMLLLGAESVVYWRATERAGAGNVVPYAIAQGYTVVMLLMITWLHPSRYTRGNDLYWVFGAYVVAKVFETLDGQVLALGHVIGGHALKHLAAAAGGLVICRMLMLRTLQPPRAVGSSTPAGAVRRRRNPMRTHHALLALVLAAARPAAAADAPLICFGSEPSWSVALVTPDTAQLTLPEAPAVAFRGASSRIDALRERVWRGAPASGGGDLVLFLRDAACSDGMSDVAHPVVARVSLPDGRFLAGCCRLAAANAAAAAESPAATPGPPAPIEGPLWRLTSLRGLDAKQLAAVRQGVTVRFDGGRLQGFSGCNQLVGSYTVAGDRVTIPAMAGTMMACPPPVMRVEDAVKAALAGTLRFAVAADGLTLTPPAEDEPTLTFVAAPAPRLDGVAWEVTGFNNGRHAVVSPLLGTTLTLTFQDGTVSGTSGCNTFRASYTRDERRLSIGPAAVTRTHCDGRGVMQQEREFLAALESTTTWAIDRDLLDLHRADGERVLSARRKDK
ncbi:META domain-containing protein [bacterium]|nr:META domain-containing protein [bacterium]